MFGRFVWTEVRFDKLAEIYRAQMWEFWWGCDDVSSQGSGCFVWVRACDSKSCFIFHSVTWSCQMSPNQIPRFSKILQNLFLDLNFENWFLKSCFLSLYIYIFFFLFWYFTQLKWPKASVSRAQWGSSSEQNVLRGRRTNIVLSFASQCVHITSWGA